MIKEIEDLRGVDKSQMDGNSVLGCFLYDHSIIFMVNKNYENEGHTSKKQKYSAVCEKTKMELSGTSEQTEGISMGQQNNLLADAGRKKARETEDWMVRQHKHNARTQTVPG